MRMDRKWNIGDDDQPTLPIGAQKGDDDGSYEDHEDDGDDYSEESGP